MKKLLLSTLLFCGAYFTQAQVTYVKKTASGLNNGSSWTDAYTNLNTAITNTASGQIWVAADTYYPGNPGQNSTTFLLKNNVEIYGGFNATETLLNQRNPAANATILSGDLDQSFSWNASDAYHVVSTGDADNTALLDGFFITRGNASGAGYDATGGGIFCRPTSNGTYSPRIVGCDLANNLATGSGSAISIIADVIGGVQAGLTMYSCNVHDNLMSGSFGGGLFAYSTGSLNFTAPVLENCLFTNNSAPSGGNHIYVLSDPPAEAYTQVTGCTFYGNYSGTEIHYNAGSINGSFNLYNNIMYNQDLSTDDVFDGNNNCTNYAVVGAANSNFDPMFINAVGGDFSLQCASPAINAGDNSRVNTSLDLVWNPRIEGAFVDLGANEKDLPNVSGGASPGTTVCAGDMLTLTGSGAISYAWSGGVSDASPFAATVNQNYTVTGTDASGCSNEFSVSITVNPLPNVLANASAPGVCAGSNVTLYGTGASSYSWDNGVSDNIPFAPLITTVYNLIGTDANGCTNIANISVTVEDPTGFTAGSDVDVCRTGTPFVTLSGNSAGIPYTWTTLGSGSWVNPSSLTPDYYLSGADASGAFVKIVLELTPAYCLALSDTLTLFMQDPTSAFAGADITVCEGAVIGSLVNASTTGSSAIQWTTNGTGSFSSTISPTAFYTFSPADVLAGSLNIGLTSYPVNPVCPIAVDTLSIIIHPSPSINLGANYTICETDSILLQTTASGGTPPYLYNWGNGGTISTANNEYYFPAATSNINLYLMDNFGCVATDTVVVFVDASEIISGTAYLGAGVLTSGNVHLIKYYPQPQLFDTLITTTLDGAGNYSFPPIPHGNYIVSVEPDTILFPNALITYLGDQTRSELANILGHVCSSPAIASLNVQQLLGGTGTGSISGEVVEWNGFGNRYNGPHNHIMVPGGPLKGIDVKLGRNPGGGIQARTSTNDLGKYNFDNLPNGNYHIYVDIPGLPMDSFYVVNVVSDSTTNLIYYADSNSVYPILPTAVGIKDYKTEQMGMGVHPNPANNYTTILFETISVNSSTQIKVFDVTGKIAMSLNLSNLPKGKHEYHLNFANQQLQSGIYFIELINESGKQTKKLIVE